MQNKLQELTDKLYNEGLSKGKQEAEELKAKAREEAAALIADAKQKAEEIVSAARKESQELKEKAENDIKMASSQVFASMKQQIEHALILKAVSAPAAQSLNETAFLQDIISTVAKAYNPENTDAVALNLLLPEAKRQELDAFLKDELTKICGAGIHISFSKNIGSGFKIGPQGEGYMIGFTGNDFENLIAEYLRPKTRKLLFGE